MAVADSRSQSVRQPLHLYIDPYPYQPVIDISPGPDDSPSPSPSSHTSPETAGTPSPDGFDPYICSVLCMYDFRSNDPDHLPFRKNEILDIVKKEDTGWWAAMRKDQDRVGWIPQAFVTNIPDAMVEKLRNTREELRVYEYEAEQLYVSAPTHRMHQLYESAEPTPYPPSIYTKKQTLAHEDIKVWNRFHRSYVVNCDVCLQASSPRLYMSKSLSPQDLLQVNTIVDSGPYNITLERSAHPRGQPPPSPSPLTPMPQPPPTYSTSLYNKPTPPTPPPSHDDTPQPSRGRDRAGSLPTHISKLKRPSTADSPSPSKLTALSEDVYHISHGTASVDVLMKRSRSQKWKQVMGLDDSLHDVLPRPVLPWYLEPTFADELEAAPDGTIRWGTLDALVEKLTRDIPIRDPISALFLNIFSPYAFLT
jgi:son of sevenless-like protein